MYVLYKNPHHFSYLFYIKLTNLVVFNSDGLRGTLVILCGGFAGWLPPWFAGWLPLFLIRWGTYFGYLLEFWEYFVQILVYLFISKITRKHILCNGSFRPYTPGRHIFKRPLGIIKTDCTLHWNRYLKNKIIIIKHTLTRPWKAQIPSTASTCLRMLQMQWSENNGKRYWKSLDSLSFVLYKLSMF